jgi:hypothetical protein
MTCYILADTLYFLSWKYILFHSLKYTKSKAVCVAIQHPIPTLNIPLDA